MYQQIVKYVQTFIVWITREENHVGRSKRLSKLSQSEEMNPNLY